MKPNKNPQYFEGVLQLRNPTDEIINFIADEMDRKGDVWIAKKKEEKDGVDLFISSNKFLKEIGLKLKARFPGELQITSRMFSQDSLTSKSVHRGCILFRYYGIKKDQIITYRGREIKVISAGKDVFGKYLDTNEKVHLKFEQLN